MPELPEVETVINIINPLIKGKTIDKIEIFYDRLIQSDIKEFIPNLLNKTFLNVTRYGKFIFLHLNDDLVIVTHLRMEGKFRYLENNENPRKKSTSLLFYFKDESCLSFDDTRKFGVMYLSTENEYKELPMIKKLGIEANKTTLEDVSLIYKKFQKNKVIKELLLDQSILCGIGNIYADETLYMSKIHPLTRGKDLTIENVESIVKNAKIVLDKAIELGGSTIHSFHPSEGVDGRFQEVLTCYGKEGEECPTCKTKFHKIFIGGRGTTFCPNCQINPYLKKAIGITGPIGSGKSSVLKYFKKLGYLTISCDEEIHNLYRESTIKNKISKILKSPFDINNKKLKDHCKLLMIENPSLKKQVEDYIYPILENKLISYIVNNELVAIEVPLLFKAHYEYMFKKIFVIKIDKNKQIENLKSRNDFNHANSLKLNNDYSYNEKNPDVIEIFNDSTLQNLYKQIDENL